MAHKDIAQCRGSNLSLRSRCTWSFRKYDSYIFFSRFVHSLSACLQQLCGYKQLVQEIETLRATPYDAENLEHEQRQSDQMWLFYSQILAILGINIFWLFLAYYDIFGWFLTIFYFFGYFWKCSSGHSDQRLLQLWSLLQPGVPLMTRKTKQWQNIGFQGNDPKTDFRGMGLLGLENLLYVPNSRIYIYKNVFEKYFSPRYFAKEYNTAARHILSHSHHPKHG